MKNLNLYQDIPKIKACLLENREERKVIHQFNHHGRELDLENLKGKYTLNEIR
ncbi:hypothetical protein [Alkaliphilus transvaalensis]|uniref:hypothetical protein n=1 Tax=Alkaliphilus transvaalensis TaxID=114628 RepID=UPI0012EC1863|nr:hypothetical protein [Alkaliphilus transvaalensis]